MQAIITYSLSIIEAMSLFIGTCFELIMLSLKLEATLTNGRVPGWKQPRGVSAYLAVPPGHCTFQNLGAVPPARGDLIQ